MDPKPRAKPDLTSWNDFCRLVLEIVAEQSPCSQPTLLVMAAARGLEEFGDGSIAELRKLLGRGVQELRARGLVQIQGGRLLLTPPRSTVDEEILELTSELELHTVEDILELTVEVPTNQTQRQAHVLDSPKPGATGKRTIVPSAKSVEDQDILDLTPDLELNPSKLDEPPTSQRQLQTQAGSPNGAREPRRQEMIASSAASAEQEDILYLTPELELHPPLHPFQRDEAPTNRAQRADEPTREEMIAAMRRFISDE